LRIVARAQSRHGAWDCSSRTSGRGGSGRRSWSITAANRCRRLGRSDTWGIARRHATWGCAINGCRSASNTRIARDHATSSRNTSACDGRTTSHDTARRRGDSAGNRGDTSGGRGQISEQGHLAAWFANADLHAIAENAAAHAIEDKRTPIYAKLEKA
jgi:hypothetical protein